MSHINEGLIKDYIDNKLDEHTRVEIETHLDSCDDCFQNYLHLIEIQTIDVSLSEDFTENIIDKLNEATVKQKEKNQPSIQLKRKKAITHYLLASGLTILLMTTGVFENFLTVINATKLDDKPSITEQLMEKTNGVLDQMKGDIE